MDNVKSENRVRYAVTNDDDGAAMVEKALAYLSEKFSNREVFNSAELAGKFACLKLGHLEVENFCVAFLDNRHGLIAWETLAKGSVDNTPVYAREILKRVLFHNAPGVVFFHNHPSGDPTPSDADIDMTRKLVKGLGLFDVRVLDHIIVAGGRFKSMGALGLLNEPEFDPADILIQLIGGAGRTPDRSHRR